MSELQERAVKEGISLPGQPVDETPQGAKEGASPTPGSETPDTAKSPEGGAKAQQQPVSEDNLPFHKHPKWKGMQDENKRLKQTLEERDRKFELQLAELKGMTQAQTKQATAGMDPEQRQALLNLVRLIKSDPDAAKELGINSIDELRQRQEQLVSSRNEESFGKEVESTLSEFSEKYGLDKAELEQEVSDFIDANPFYSSKDYSQGAYRAAATAYLFPKLDEMKERAANLKLIKEQEAKKKANAESPGAPSGTETSKPASMRERLAQMVRDGGGEVSI